VPDKIIKGHIKVNTYSGYKANEKPVNLIIDNMSINIVDIIYRWIEPEKDCFKVKGDNGKIYCLYWFREKDLWQVIENC
jgi:hypothetical protein